MPPALPRRTTSVSLANSSQWKTGKFRLLGARFLNSQNGGADFRIAVLAATLHVRKVIVTRLGMPVEAGQNLRGWQQHGDLPGFGGRPVALLPG